MVLKRCCRCLWIFAFSIFFSNCATINMEEIDSETMDTSSVAYSTNPVVALTPTWSNGNATLSLSHTHFLSNTTYTIAIDVGKDIAGNDLNNIPYTWSFATGGERAIYLPLVLKNH